ncbi:MAG: mechanosensitive ion channel family protein [Bacteroidota bacterium]
MELLINGLSTLVDTLYSWAPRLVGAIVVLLIGLWIIGSLTKAITQAMKRSGLDKDVVPFLSSMVNVLLKVMLVLSVAGVVGIETTSFVALIGMVGFAIGMALQGTLSHFAAGVMILVFKPYRVGDLVDLQGQLGHVDEIQVFNTILTSLDHKKVIVPNGIATSGIMTNLSTNEYLRVDLNAAMPYEEDFERVQGIILEALRLTPKVMSEPAPEVEIEKFNEHNVLLAVRPYAKTEDYWPVYFNAYKNVKAALGQNNIKVAYPVREVKVEQGTNLVG